MKNVWTDSDPLIINCVHKCLITLTPSVLNRAKNFVNNYLNLIAI